LLARGDPVLQQWLRRAARPVVQHRMVLPQGATRAMAVDPFFFDLICRAARETGGGTMCAAGYPDMLVGEAMIAQALGAEVMKTIPVHADSEKMRAWHGVGNLLPRILDSGAILSALGYRLTVIDVQRVRGDETVIDLNLPLPPDFSDTYDLVLDTGTCEHCFNIGQAALNLASLVKQNGLIIQGLPLNMYNHGFYNVCPTWFHDFFPANGFEVVLLYGVTDWLTQPKVFELPPYARFNDAPKNSGIVVVARRREVKTIQFPTQYKYRVSPGSSR
jgi:hypothetical protein